MVNLKVVPAHPCDIDFGWYEAIRAELVRKTVSHKGRVLDIGCGNGQILFMLSGQIREGIGIDINQTDIDRAEAKRQLCKITNVRFQRASATTLPYPSDSFDFVLLLGDVLTYPSTFGKHEKVVAEIRRILKDGGIAIHESMNWEWEFRYPYPPSDFSLTRTGENNFTLHRIHRDESGLENYKNHEVLPGTPLYHWILEQDWPVSPQGFNTSLQVKEATPISEEWLKFTNVSYHKHYRPQDLVQLYKNAGFHNPEVFAYGQTYDIAVKAGLHKNLVGFQSDLATAEADLALTLRLGSGPWLFLIAKNKA